MKSGKEKGEGRGGESRAERELENPERGIREERPIREERGKERGKRRRKE